MRSSLWKVVLRAVTFLLVACGDASLESYKPKDQDEADIISLLKKYKNAINNDDKQKLLSCFHNDSKFMNPTGDMIVKDDC